MYLLSCTSRKREHPFRLVEKSNYLYYTANTCSNWSSSSGFRCFNRQRIQYYHVLYQRELKWNIQILYCNKTGLMPATRKVSMVSTNWWWQISCWIKRVGRQFNLPAALLVLAKLISAKNYHDSSRFPDIKSRYSQHCCPILNCCVPKFRGGYNLENNRA